MPVTIPTTSNASAYKQRLTLDNEAYEFKFEWNIRDESWTMSIFTDDGTQLAAGIKLTVNFALSNRYKYIENFLQGEIIAVDMSNTGTRIGRDDLGSRVLLMYFTPDELEAT
jgi:hypothetical protein